jgi:hypothetical protein
VKISVKMSADTEAFIRQLSGFRMRLHTELLQTADTLGALLVGWTRDTILAQNFHPLTPRYKSWKAKHGYDTRILLMTHQMFDSITYKRMSSSMALISGQIGFKASAMHSHWTSSRKHPAGDSIKRRTKRGRSSAWSPGASRGSSSIGMAELGKWLEGENSEVSRFTKKRPFFEPTARGHRQEVWDHFMAAVVRAWGGK